MLALSGLALAAMAAPAGADEAATLVFQAPAWGLSVRYPADLTVLRRFKTNYFDRGDWRMSYAAGAGDGEPIVAFALPDKRVEDAGGAGDATIELTIGASRDPATVRGCTTYGMNSGDNVILAHRRIGDTMFSEVPDNDDGGARQRVRSDDFRAVRNNTCWAIDVRLYTGGTSNATPVFTSAEIAHVDTVLDGISFGPPQAPLAEEKPAH